MVVDRVPDNVDFSIGRAAGRPRQDVYQAQQTIFNFLLEIVKKWPAEDVLNEFKCLFLQHSETVSSDIVPALYSIVFSNNQAEFHNTLKRSCYILINNWEVARTHQSVQDLILLFDDPIIHKPSLSPTLKRLRAWLLSFVNSQDFQDLKLFVASRFAVTDNSENLPWTSRYTSFLLVPQYVDMDNPLEQREAARAMSRRLKDKFKFDLAMYTAHAQSAKVLNPKRSNPTTLGDSALRLIKMIVAKRGPFSHRNLARIFENQTQQISYRTYKKSLLSYLLFSVDEPASVQPLKVKLSEKLERLYRKHDTREIDPSMRLRTCNRIMDYLTTEDKTSPSELFTMLLSYGNPLTMAIILLKLVLISPNSHPYLEARLADLIRYYEQFPKADCQWIINFLEIYSVTFAIYSGDVEYNLVRIQANANGTISTHKTSGFAEGTTLDDYRVFSQSMSSPNVSDNDDMAQINAMSELDNQLE
jgi:hypothetical protein